MLKGFSVMLKASLLMNCRSPFIQKSIQNLFVSKDYNFSIKSVSICVPQECPVPLGDIENKVPSSAFTPLPPLLHTGCSGCENLSSLQENLARLYECVGMFNNSSIVFLFKQCYTYSPLLTLKLPLSSFIDLENLCLKCENIRKRLIKAVRKILISFRMLLVIFQIHVLVQCLGTRVLADLHDCPNDQ